jgi:beta-glucosidase
VEQRVEDLLARMTLEEKIAQITCIWNRKQEFLTSAGEFDAAKAKRVFPAGIGQVARPSDLHGGGDPYDHPFRNVRETITLVNAIQHYAVKNTRLGIPVLFHEEGTAMWLAMPRASPKRSPSPAPGIPNC